jgi:GntR family transcriptional regulator
MTNQPHGDNRRPKPRPALGVGGQRPLYRRLLGSIDTRIRRGDWSTGAQLPSERALCEQFGVSRSTVRQALDQLSRAGVLERVQGRGTFVTTRGPITQPLEHVTAFREALAAQGMTPGMRIISRTRHPCDDVLGRSLGVAPNTLLARLVYVGLGNGEPLVVYRSYFPAALIEDTLGVFCAAVTSGGTPGLPLELYAARAGVSELKAEQTFEARLATAEETALLSLQPPAPVFLVTSVLCGPGGRPLEYRRAVYRGDRYKFNIERVQRPRGGADRAVDRGGVSHPNTPTRVD